MTTISPGPVHTFEEEFVALQGVRIGFVSRSGAVGMQPLLDSLREAGAIVVEMPPNTTGGAATGSLDIVLIRTGVDGINSVHSLEWFRQMSALHHIIGLLDEDSFPFAAAVTDFLVEPFSVPELIVRLRRTLAFPSSSGALEFGDLAVDLAARQVSLNERVVQLTFHEFELLRTLVSARGAALTREVLAANVYAGELHATESRGIDILVHRIRAKLGRGSGAIIQTIRGVGYRIDTDALVSRKVRAS